MKKSVVLISFLIVALVCSIINVGAVESVQITTTSPQTLVTPNIETITPIEDNNNVEIDGDDNGEIFEPQHIGSSYNRIEVEQGLYFIQNINNGFIMNNFINERIYARKRSPCVNHIKYAICKLDFRFFNIFHG